MSKELIIKRLYKELNLSTIKEGKEIYEVFFDILEKDLKTTGSIKLPGIGIIEIKTKKARSIKIPTLKEKKEYPDRPGLRFKENSKFFLNYKR
jgi:nucleoid DNA-binding protein